MVGDSIIVGQTSSLLWLMKIKPQFTLLHTKNISNNILYFIFTCREFSKCREQFFQLHSNKLSILSLFLLFYFNFFFSLSSFLSSGDPQATPPPSSIHQIHTPHPKLTKTTRSTPRPRLALHPLIEIELHFKINPKLTTRKIQQRPPLYQETTPLSCKPNIQNPATTTTLPSCKQQTQHPKSTKIKIKSHPK